MLRDAAQVSIFMIIHTITSNKQGVQLDGSPNLQHLGGTFISRILFVCALITILHIRILANYKLGVSQRKTRSANVI